MKIGIYAAILSFIASAPVYAIDQWPGQSDFGNLNGPTSNNNGPNRPILDFRFGRPYPQTQPFSTPQSRASSLTPAEYSYCRDRQMASPAQDISCD